MSVGHLSAEEYRKAAVQEKALAWAVQYVGQMEEGINGGPFVLRVLRSVGLGVGHAWCAAFVSFCLLKAGSIAGPLKHRYRVSAWRDWAVANGKLEQKPFRGAIAIRLNRDGTGHVGFVTGVTPEGKVRSIEGNTNEEGSREGDGVYRKLRKGYWAGYIRWF